MPSSLRKFLSWLAAMITPAPAVKPTMTECDMKLTSVPSRKRPMVNSITPTRKASVSARTTYWSEAGTAMALSAEAMTSDPATVGPDTSCQDEPNSAATIAGIMPA